MIDPRGRITWRSDGEQPDALLAHELTRTGRLSRRSGPPGTVSGAMPGLHGLYAPRERVVRPADPAVRSANLHRIVRLFRPYCLELSVVCALIVVSSGSAWCRPSCSAQCSTPSIPDGRNGLPRCSWPG